ncbi:MAG: NAD-dependent epimerase/dehydratase family protein [Planctomycetes bacterium]|nr:NAD-dependent epimerase/dehydratase family protein [Planctomycetota bacterium]
MSSHSLQRSSPEVVSGARPLRVGLIGAGAVSRIFYLPVFLSALTDLQLTLVADQSQAALDRLGKLPKGTRQVTGGFGEALLANRHHMDAVIVALPHHLHLPCVTQALQLGLHVFCEKPLGLDEAETDIMRNAARDAGRILAVCQPRRSFPAASLIQKLIELNWLGEVERIDWDEGQPYAWPAESLSLLRRETGGEELFDIGAHVLDLLCWWMGSLDLVEYADDSKGGSGAEFWLELKSRSNVPVHVQLSRLYQRKNQVVIQCRRGRIVWDLRDPTGVKIDLTELGDLPHPSVTFPASGIGWPLQAFHDQLTRFGQAIHGQAKPVATADDALLYARLFSACRQRQQPPTTRIVQASGGLTAVTGAAGFIGCRLVERLLERGDSVRALVRRAQSCVRLARLPVDMELCDVRKRDDVQHSLRSAETVIHCAGSAASDRDTIVQGTLNVLHAAEAAGVRRVVVLSSMLAYGDPPLVGQYDEGFRGTVSRMPYGAAKREMEQRCLEFARSSRVEVVILQPTCVYGPFAPDFVQGPLESMLSDEFFLMEQGTGRANLVYVDNLIEAALLAANHPGITGQRYLVNDSANITWAEYFDELSQGALGNPISKYPSLTLPDLSEILRARARQRQFPGVIRKALLNDPLARDWLIGSWGLYAWSRGKRMFKRSAAKPLVPSSAGPAPTTTTPDPKLHLVERLRSQPRLYFEQPSGEFFASQAVFSANRIRRELGWNPAVGLAEGIQKTIRWAELAVAGRQSEVAATK